ncbi:unnamed protein product, partial [Prorocentrum cordatum]
AMAQEGKMKTVCVKARTENHTLESLKLKGDQYRKTQAEVAAWAQHLEEQDASPSASPNGASPGGVQSAAAAAAGIGPMLNPSAMACSRTVVTGEGGRGPRTPGAKPRGAARSAAMSAEGKQSEVEELVERRIAALDVNRCWSGTAVGRELRWARESRQTIMEGCPNPRDSEVADKLNEHILVCDAICQLVEKPIATLPKAKLESLLKAIEAGDEDLPSKWKLDVLKLKVAEFIKIGDFDVHEFFVIVAPWEVQAEVDIMSDTRYKPTRPRVLTCDGSLSDKIVACEGFFMETLAQFIQSGKEGQLSLTRFCIKCLDWLDEKCPDDEEFDDVVSAMTTCLKATLCIADPVRLEYKDALLEMTAAKSTEVGKACLRHLSLAVKRSAHYAALKAASAQDEFDQYFLKTSELFPQMVQLMAAMDAATDIREVERSGTLKAALELLPNVVTYCRPGSFGNFKEQVSAKLDEYINSYLFCGALAEADGSAQTSMLADAKALVTIAKTSISEKGSLWATAMDKIKEKESEINQFNANKGLAQLAESLDDEILMNLDRLKEVLPVIESVLAAGGRGVEVHKDSAATIFGKIYSVICQYVRAPTEAAPRLHILMTLTETNWLAGESAVKLDKVITMLKAWGSLSQQRAQWAQSGNDDAVRLIKDGSANLVTSIRSSVKAMQSTGLVAEVIGAQSDVTAATEEMNSAANVCMAIVTDAMKAATAALKPFATGTEAFDQPWDQDLAADAGMDSVLKRVEETILQIDGGSFQKRIDAVLDAKKRAVGWAQVFEVQQDEDATKEAVDTMRVASATKFTALVVHAFKTCAGQAPKMRRMVNAYRKEAAEADAVSAMRQDVEWAAKLASLKGST